MGHPIAAGGSFRALWSGGTVASLADAELMQWFLRRLFPPLGVSGDIHRFFSA